MDRKIFFVFFIPKKKKPIWFFFEVQGKATKNIFEALFALLQILFILIARTWHTNKFYLYWTHHECQYHYGNQKKKKNKQNKKKKKKTNKTKQNKKKPTWVLLFRIKQPSYNDNHIALLQTLFIIFLSWTQKKKKKKDSIFSEIRLTIKKIGPAILESHPKSM